MKVQHRLYFAALLILVSLSACDSDKHTFTEFPTECATVSENFTTVPTEADPTTEVTEASVTDQTADLIAEPGAHQLRFETENNEEYMEYYLYIPEKPVKQMPLVVFLHGAVEVGKVSLLQDYGIASVVNEIYGNNYPFLLLLPCTHKPTWTSANVPETLISLIDSLIDEYCIDPHRIILTGHSMGSMGTWKIASLYPDFFAAAVPVSCGIEEEIHIPELARIPIRAFCGTVGPDESSFNHAMHQIIEDIVSAGGNASMTVIEGADHDDMVTAAYTEELFNWMLEQKDGD